MPAVYEENITTRKITKLRPVFSSLVLVIPFQPSMWDENSIQSVLSYTMEIVQTKMKGRYSDECSNKVLARLEKLFAQLNFNTHRKSLAVMLTPGEEKAIYLSFPVKPIVFFNESVSLLDFVSNIKQEADFYYLVLNKGSASLYDYNNKHIGKVYEQNNVANALNLYKNASGVIELLNSKNEKAVFVTGSPNLVERFCNSAYYSKNYFTLLYDAAPFSDEIIQTLVKEITCHWRYWQSKFIAGRVMLAQKANSLISNTETVLQALRKSADGLLLMDKHFKHQLQKSYRTGSVVFQKAGELISQIEKFLTRGNRIEITETGLLKDLGGIVLLPDTLPGVSGVLSCSRHSEIAGGGNLFSKDY